MLASDRITDALEASGEKRTGRQWTCPMHSGSRPSVTITQGDGQAFVYCHSCGKEATPDILAAIGLTLADLYDEPRRRKPRTRREKSPEKPLAPDTGGCCIGCCFPLHDSLPPETHVRAVMQVKPYTGSFNQSPRPYCRECAQQHRQWEADNPLPERVQEDPPRSPRGLLLCLKCGRETTDPVGHGICGECFYSLKDRDVPPSPARWGLGRSPREEATREKSP